MQTKAEQEKEARAEFLTKPVVGRFRVLEGKHQEGGRIYKKGEIVESRKNLLDLNGLHSNMKKFEAVDSGRGSKVVNADLPPHHPQLVSPTPMSDVKETELAGAPKSPANKSKGA